MHIAGKCHCGNIAFELEWEGEAPGIPARACGCTFCVKHGGMWTSHPKAKLAVAVRDEALVSKYVFGTKTATFHVCARCGVVALATCEIEGRSYAVVNVNTFEDFDPSSLRHSPANFESEEVDGRLARRKRNWIGDVSFRQS